MDGRRVRRRPARPGHLQGGVGVDEAMIPMPIVAMRMRSFGPAGAGGSTLGFSTWASSASPEVATAEAAEARVADLRNERASGEDGVA